MYTFTTNSKNSEHAKKIIVFLPNVIFAVKNVLYYHAVHQFKKIAP